MKILIYAFIGILSLHFTLVPAMAISTRRVEQFGHNYQNLPSGGLFIFGLKGEDNPPVQMHAFCMEHDKTLISGHSYWTVDLNKYAWYGSNMEATKTVSFSSPKSNPTYPVGIKTASIINQYGTLNTYNQIFKGTSNIYSGNNYTNAPQPPTLPIENNNHLMSTTTPAENETVVVSSPPAVVKETSEKTPAPVVVKPISTVTPTPKAAKATTIKTPAPAVVRPSTATPTPIITSPKPIKPIIKKPDDGQKELEDLATNLLNDTGTILKEDPLAKDNVITPTNINPLENTTVQPQIDYEPHRAIPAPSAILLGGIGSIIATTLHRRKKLK